MATAQEQPEPEPKPDGDAADDGFMPGLAVGVGLMAIVVHIALTSMGDLENMYKDFGHPDLPLLTRVTISSAWRLGVPLVGFAVLGTLIVRRPKAHWFYFAAALACFIAAAMTFWYPTAPMHELANLIHE